MRLLYVCYNNKGRSPALEAYTRHYLGLKGVYEPQVVVDSAGAGVESIRHLRQTSDHISRTVRRLLHDGGLDLSSETIKHLGEVGTDWDLVLATDSGVVKAVQEHFPGFAGKLQLAREYAGYRDRLDMRGPYYHQQKFEPSEWTETVGYELMLYECKNAAKRIAQRISEESRL